MDLVDGVFVLLVVPVTTKDRIWNLQDGMINKKMCKKSEELSIDNAEAQQEEFLKIGRFAVGELNIQIPIIFPAVDSVALLHHIKKELDMWIHRTHSSLKPETDCTAAPLILIMNSAISSTERLTSPRCQLTNRAPQPWVRNWYRSFAFPSSSVGSFFRMSGNAKSFPCDAQGRPILRWTNIKVENAKSVTFSGAMSRAGTMRIEIQPDTTIHLWGEDNFYDEESEPDDEWHQIYAGPLNMEFNYKALKEFRVARGFTQKEVADAIGANVRTYQKWEGKNSTPDGHYLLRIMNWLQIDDVQDLIFYREPSSGRTEDEDQS